MSDLDLVLAFALVTPVAFGAVWSLFGVLSWVEDRLEERAHRLSPDWVERRKWGRP